MCSSLHAILVSRQSDDELRRKKAKAFRRGAWTQEDIDYAYREADGRLEFFRLSDADIQRFDRALIASSEFLYELKV